MSIDPCPDETEYPKHFTRGLRVEKAKKAQAEKDRLEAEQNSDKQKVAEKPSFSNPFIDDNVEVFTANFIFMGTRAEFDTLCGRILAATGVESLTEG